MTANKKLKRLKKAISSVDMDLFESSMSDIRASGRLIPMSVFLECLNIYERSDSFMAAVASASAYDALGESIVVMMMKDLALSKSMALEMVEYGVDMRSGDLPRSEFGAYVLSLHECRLLKEGVVGTANRHEDIAVSL